MADLYQKTEAFDKEHEGRWGYVVYEGWRVFEDGSRRSTTSHGELGCERNVLAIKTR